MLRLQVSLTEKKNCYVAHTKSGESVSHDLSTEIIINFLVSLPSCFWWNMSTAYYSPLQLFVVGRYENTILRLKLFVPYIFICFLHSKGRCIQEVMRFLFRSREWRSICFLIVFWIVNFNARLVGPLCYISTMLKFEKLKKNGPVLEELQYANYKEHGAIRKHDLPLPKNCFNTLLIKKR